MIQFVFRLIKPFHPSIERRLKQPFEECPKYMNWQDVIALAYKYYYKPMLADIPGNAVEFNQQKNALLLRKVKESSEHHLSMSMGGDLLPYARLLKADADYFWSELGEWFFGADLVFANLETPIDLSERLSVVPEVMLSDMRFNANEELFSLFSGGDRKYDILSLANNHSMDMGEKGLMYSLNFLDSKEILPIGVSRKNHMPYALIEKNGITLSMHAWTYSLNKEENGKDDAVVNLLRLNSENPEITPLLKELKVARRKGAEYQVLYLHMGNAYQFYPAEHIRKTLHQIIEHTGCELIVCGHGHNIQPAEVYAGSLIFHSLGDFIGSDIYGGCRFPLMLKIHLNRDSNGKIMSTYETQIAYLDLQKPAKACLRKLDDSNGAGVIKEKTLLTWWQCLRQRINF